MKRKRCALVSITAILFLSLVSSASAINGKSNQATLRGLKGFGVLVEKLPPEVEQEGLNRLQLQLEVESKLRWQGLKY